MIGAASVAGGGDALWRDWSKHIVRSHYSLHVLFVLYCSRSSHCMKIFMKKISFASLVVPCLNLIIWFKSTSPPAIWRHKLEAPEVNHSIVRVKYAYSFYLVCKSMLCLSYELCLLIPRHKFFSFETKMFYCFSR